MHETIDIDSKDAALTDTESVLVRAAQRCIVSALDHSRANKIALLSDDAKKLLQKLLSWNCLRKCCVL